MVEVLRVGYCLPFLSPPPLSSAPLPMPSYSPTSIKGAALEEVTLGLVVKGAVELAPLPSPGFYSRLFVVWKTSGSWRPVIDLSHLNRFVDVSPFQMETIQSVLLSVRQGDWMASIDLKEAYLQVPVHPASRHFLRFVFRDKVYQFKALCFGLSTAPQVFTRVMAPVSAILHSMGIRMRRYLDDWLVQSSSRESLLRDLQTVLRLCHKLGIVVNPQKSNLVPSQVVQYLRVIIDPTSFRASPSQERISKLQSTAEEFQSSASPPASLWLSLLGVLSSLAHLVPGGRLRMRSLQLCLHRSWDHLDLEAPVSVSAECLRDLQWWLHLPRLSLGVSLCQVSPDLHFWSDASDVGWGAHLDRQVASGLWDSHQAALSINARELIAVKLGLHQFQSSLRGRTVAVFCDNTTAVAYLRKEGGTRSPLLNDYFASVFTVEEDREEATPYQMTVAAQLFLVDITEEDVMRVIDKLKICKSPGPDKIYPRILKEVKEAICKPLCVIFNLFLRTGKVVSEWKLANVTPLFKKGDKSNPGNYRPISLTSVVCKLMESILRDKIVEFLEKNNIIRDSQHGFRNRRSCLTNLLDFLHDIYEMYEEGRAVDIIYLDFQKAFDKVPHRKLLNKVESHGISGHIHHWISDWLCDRKQRVVLNGKFSDWRNVSSGVPQGSVLGPILFLIYINDLDEDVKCKISKFADYTKIANRVISLSQQQELQKDLNTLGEWAVDSQMFFNIDKCKVLHIGNRNVQANYTMNGKQLAKVEQEKDLGVVISSDLKPSKQCSEVVITANKLIGFIGRSFEFRTEEIILNLYNSLVRPHLEYCVQCWSPYYKKDIEKLEGVQRRMTKLISRLRNKPYEERLSELNLFSLTKRRLRGDLIEVFKIIKGIENMDIEKYFTIDTSNITRNNGYKIVGK